MARSSSLAGRRAGAGPRHGRRHVSGPIAGALVLALAAFAPAVQGAVAVVGGGVGDELFAIAETLMLPTHDGVTLRLIPDTAMSLRVSYGTHPEALAESTAVQAVPAGSPYECRLRELSDNTTYYYRVHYAVTGGTGRVLARPVHSFTTLPAPGRAFTFAYATDSHQYEGWTDDVFDGKPDGEARFRLTMDNLLGRRPRFLVIGGDFVQTQCSCAGGVYEGESYAPGNALTVEQASLRYQVAFSPEEYGRVTADVPFVYVLGNHDGEGGWYSDALFTSSRTARLHTFANPASVYPSHEDGYYYAFEAGDALVVVVDVMRFTPVKPTGAQSWTLGAAQLAWLEAVLSTSSAPWRFVFAEHLIGGEPTPTLIGAGYYYGRGGLRATLDDPSTPDVDEEDQITGLFKGEQQLVQWIEEQTAPPGGSSFFLTGHDHVAITPTEKLRADGGGTHTYHVKGGRAGFVGPPWANDDGFKVEMDFDSNGTADYDQPEVGTRKPGFFLIHVDGPDRVTFEYVVTSLDDAELNDTVLFSKTIEAPCR